MTERPRTVKKFEADFGKVLAYAIKYYLDDRKLTSASINEIQGWLREWRMRADQNHLSEFKTFQNAYESERMRHLEWVDGFEKVATADRDGYIRQFLFRIATIAGVLVTFIFIWVIASILVNGKPSMPGLRLITPNLTSTAIQPVTVPQPLSMANRIDPVSAIKIDPPWCKVILAC